MKSLIVRRGLSQSYYFFMKAMARANKIEMVVDRRLSERRAGDSASTERRVGERRRRPPASWTQDDYIALPQGEASITTKAVERAVERNERADLYALACACAEPR